MMISIPTKARDNFISLCKEAKEALTEIEFNKACDEARSYSNCIKDICGISVWGSIIREADMEVGAEDYPVCCGVPMMFKPL